ncbi:uracil-DNA glycosylase family protein [Portibacter marinus]|uniref:uracil-DNA glycosylase family protein n=1 Tax=Portibacter marinus TaxID=2898660 RepID=UPI001F4309AD|nr:uracil-DNA glycosylase family protein [Portibacter marinus]
MKNLLQNIRSCTLCADQLPLGPRPIVVARPTSKIILLSQAPGSIVHDVGKPWADKSGDNLRDWLGVDEDIFYNPDQFAVVPMGFCYPGRGKSGDLPPMKICAPTWHPELLSKIKDVRLTLLIGKYAQDAYLNSPYKTLTQNVKKFEQFLPKYFPLPHPSPRNNIWQAKNQWFVQEVIPSLKNIIQNLLFFDNRS